MMIKLIEYGSQTFDVPATQLIKISSSGLRGHDLNTLIKRSSHEFVDALKKIQIKSGEVPIHLIAMGSKDFYGQNRNQDAWDSDELRKSHNTFVKYAKFYRSHLNNPNHENYGIVKHSMFNENMHRVELLVLLNGTKEAAARNKGSVADKEMSKLESGKEIPVSMSCKVAYDVCVICGNKAKDRSHYCTSHDEGGQCKRAGCKNGLGTVYDDGLVQYVDNPNSIFFDISHVFRPADRTAYVLGKAASNSVIGGAELAEMNNLTLPYELLAESAPTKIANQIKLAYKLAELEQNITNDAYSLAFTKQADADYSNPPKNVWSVLAKSKISLPIEGFLSVITQEPVKEASIKAIKDYLPSVFTRLTKSGELIEALQNSPYTAISVVPEHTISWTRDKLAYSLDKTNITVQLTKSALYQTHTQLRQPVQTTNLAAESIARQYALYKLAFLDSVESQDNDFDLTCKLVIRQNYV